MMFDSITTAWTPARGGKRRAIAVATAQRSPVAPDQQKKPLELGAEPVGTTSEAFGAMVRREVVKWGDVVRESGAKVE